MCLLFLYINPDPTPSDYKIILVNNRDEFYSRPTGNAHTWKTEPKIIAGEDLAPGREGGTWLAVSERGKIACLLNIFQTPDEMKAMAEDSKGRGYLAVNYLTNDVYSPEEYFNHLNESRELYNKYSLILLDLKRDNCGVYYNNADGNICKIEHGFHGFGNCYPNKPFNKVTKGTEAFEGVMKQKGYKDQHDDLIEALLSLMQSKESHYPDDILSQQGKGHSEAMIKGLSSVWVSIPEFGYGTRTTTVILVDAENHVFYHERTMAKPSATSDEFQTTKFQFQISDNK